VSPSLLDERRLPDSTSSVHEVVPWLARLTLRMPDGVVRHPALLGTVREKIGRRCAIDVAHTGMALSYKARGATMTEASADSWQVCVALMTHLGVDESAIEEHELVRADDLPIWPILHPTSLMSVPTY